MFTLVLRMERTPELARIDASYRFILSRLTQALADRGIHAAIEGTCDLAIDGRKFSGHAQQRKRDYLLHHGTVLYDFDLAAVSRYLHLPPRQPEYRARRPHQAFLRNLPLGADEIKRLLRSAWSADSELQTWPEVRVYELTGAKYSREEWIRRR